MRTNLLWAVLATTIGLASSATAADYRLNDYTLGSQGGGECNTCDPCGGGRHKHHLKHKHRNMDGLSATFNCGCSGSYKFPVPPQYTYHWPGSVYSQELMTNYHSPWRFPAIKPYSEEVLVPISDNNSRGLRQASATSDASLFIRPGQVEPMSELMERYFR